MPGFYRAKEVGVLVCGDTLLGHVLRSEARFGVFGVWYLTKDLTRLGWLPVPFGAFRCVCPD